MVGAMLKLSYSKIGDNNLIGGICGSCFCIRNDIVLSAHHILHRKSFIPNTGFPKAQFWLLFPPNIVFEIKRDVLIKEIPEIDSSYIVLPKGLIPNHLKISNKEIKSGDKCHNEGFRSDSMPQLNAGWDTDGLIISGFNLGRLAARGAGMITELGPVNINTNDVKMKDIKCIKLSYGGLEGMSGGPLFNDNDEIIGLMSFGLPPDKKEKDVLFAVSIKEIVKMI